MNKSLFLIAIIIALLALFCQSENEAGISQASFSGYINITSQEYNSTSFIIKRDDRNRLVGHNGIIIYRSFPNYYAFDLICTHEKNKSCLVEITEDAKCKCPCCGSEFLIASEYGDIIKGPAKYGLIRYNTTLTNNGTILHIYN